MLDSLFLYLLVFGGLIYDEFHKIKAKNTEESYKEEYHSFFH